MKIINAEIVDVSFNLRKADIEISDDKRILRVADKLSYTDSEMVLDCEGYTVVPGFIDIHIHGSVGRDTCDGSRESIDEMAEYLITKGVTGFCPTTLTVSEETISNALSAIHECMEKPDENGAAVLGANMEGPFISKEKKGAQNEAFVRKPDAALFRKFFEESGGIVKVVDIAPEQEGGFEFIKEVKGLCPVSIAHTCATYDEAKKSFDAGITHATHLFNGMTGINHREPGVVGAVISDDRVMAELICDGHHIHPAVIKMIFNLMPDRVCVISDALAIAGLPEGTESELGGLPISVKNGACVLENGTIAGSISNLHEELKNLVSWGIPFGKAVKAVSFNPAKSIGVDNETGSITPGKRADLVILDKNLEIVGVYH